MIPMKIRRRTLLGSALAAAAALPLRRVWGADATDLPARTLSGEPTVVPRADLRDLAGSLRGRVLLGTDADYNTVRRIWNGAFDLHPALIVQCTGMADAMQAVAFARSHKLLTAVRGGGHSTSGKSSCDGGIMIDLSPMSGVRVDPQARRAWVEPGTLLGQLDRETAAFGLVTTAGTVSHTGAAGLTLGGGFGRVGRRFGLACDNLVGADVLTAAGQRVRASATENPDLFWALRGGGGNFGVVTEFEYSLHDMNPIIYGGVIAWPLAAAGDVLRQIAELMANAPDELNVEPVIASPPGAPPMIMAEVCWSGEHARGEKALAGLRGFGKPLFDKVGPMPYVVLQSMNDGINHHGVKHYGKAGYLPRLDGAVIDALLDAYRSAPQGQVAFIFQASGGAISRVASDATAFPNRSSPWWVMVAANWEDAADTPTRLATARATWKRVEPLSRGFYVNSADDRADSEVAGNYGANYARLVQLKDKYDPGNQFRLNVNIKPSRA
jgi:FAD/FMN-containing dehydrogenase